MKISPTIRRQMLLDAEKKLNQEVAQALLSASLDPDDYADEEAAISAIASTIEYMPGSSNVRFTGAYGLWSSIPKAGNEAHWMHDLCSATDSYMLFPIDELYGRTDLYDALQDNDFLGPILLHVVVYHQPNLAAIAYTEINATTHRRLNNFHPYFSSPTLHEFLKLLMEWQWALYFADNSEPMAVLSDNVLKTLNLDVRNEDDPIVSFLMSLPDQQVFQYMKIGSCQHNDEEPPASDAFRIWALKKGFVKGGHSALGDAYEKCLMLRQVKAKLAEL
jgi:hypothetical protein